MSTNKTNTDKQETEPFTESGKCFDEVRLIFDDGQELFVSQNFLMMFSPVFEAMFKNNFKEKQSMSVNIREKSYADFLEFLSCINPATLKAIGEENVLRIVPIAEEYLVISIVGRCKAYMKTWLDKELKGANGCGLSNQLPAARKCFLILTAAVTLNYKDVTEHAISIVSKFAHRIYYGSYDPDTAESHFLSYSWEIDGDLRHAEDDRKECQEFFKNLPAEVRIDILSRRLARYPDNDTK